MRIKHHKHVNSETLSGKHIGGVVGRGGDGVEVEEFLDHWILRPSPSSPLPLSYIFDTIYYGTNSCGQNGVYIGLGTLGEQVGRYMNDLGGLFNVF